MNVRSVSDSIVLSVGQKPWQYHLFWLQFLQIQLWTILARGFENHNPKKWHFKALDGCTFWCLLACLPASTMASKIYLDKTFCIFYCVSKHLQSKGHLQSNVKLLKECPPPHKYCLKDFQSGSKISILRLVLEGLNNLSMKLWKSLWGKLGLFDVLCQSKRGA